MPRRSGAPEVDDSVPASGPSFQGHNALPESVLSGVGNEFSQSRHLGESGVHLGGEWGDSNFRSRDFHSALLDFETKALRRKGNLRSPEHRPVLLRSTPHVPEGLEAVLQTHRNVPHDHPLEVVAEIVKILCLRREVVLQAVSAEPLTFLEYHDPELCVVHRYEA